MPMVYELLSEADTRLSDIDVLAFGRGPGSFTGLRVAAGVVQGLALGLDCPVVPVSTLAALAHQAFRRTEARCAAAALDARMGEVYWGVFERGDNEPVALQPERVTAPNGVPRAKDAGNWASAGSGWDVYCSELQTASGIDPRWRLHEALPRARDIAELAVFGHRTGNGVTAADAHPVYLRNKVAEKPA
jgi:tRNA threonylcarbamoyladenosine biosynthesis protein TsaB